MFYIQERKNKVSQPVSALYLLSVRGLNQRINNFLFDIGNNPSKKEDGKMISHCWKQIGNSELSENGDSPTGNKASLFYTLKNRLGFWASSHFNTNV